MDEGKMNSPIPPSDWSPLQILDHMMRTNGPYVTALPAVVQAAPEGGATDVRHTWFGGFLIKVAGPKGNAPAPKQVVPAAGPLPSTTMDAYLEQSSTLRQLMELGQGKDLNRARLSNPFVKIFRMSVADVFEIVAQHTERHVGQIEASLGRSSATG